MNYQVGDTLEVVIPATPLRSDPSDKSEMVSQMLFGESAIILDSKNQWVHVKCILDDYEGWADEKGFALMKSESEEDFMTTSSIALFQSEMNEWMHLSLGARCTSLDGEYLLHAHQKWRKLSGEWSKTDEVKSVGFMLERGMQFVNSPYLWGGRSIMGIDCSGLTQVLFALQGKKLPRDASQQVTLGDEVSFVQNALPGDLAFFGKEEEAITHVGILLEGTRILHASGKVRIDKLDQQGIYNLDTHKYTHHLRVIKRI